MILTKQLKIRQYALYKLHSHRTLLSGVYHISHYYCKWKFTRTCHSLLELWELPFPFKIATVNGNMTVALYCSCTALVRLLPKLQGLDGDRERLRMGRRGCRVYCKRASSGRMLLIYLFIMDTQQHTSKLLKNSDFLMQ